MREIEGETNERVPVIKMKQKVNKLDWIKPTKIIRSTHLYDLNFFCYLTQISYCNYITLIVLKNVVLNFHTLI